MNFLGKIPILKEFEWFDWFEWFEWLGPSPIEPFNSGRSPAHRALRRAHLQGPGEPELKGSIGEGPNHSNFSDRSSARILGIERKPRKTTSSNSFKIGIFPRKFKNFRNFQHFLNYRRNSDKISSKSEQKSVKRIQK